MDIYDKRILDELQKNGRLSNQDLSERINLSPSPCLKRLRNLERAGIIKGYTALIDQKLYGLHLTVFIRVQLKQHDDEFVQKFEDHVQRIDEIMECYLVTGDGDYILRACVEDLDAYEYFIRNKMHKIPYIQSFTSSVVYSEIKKSTVLPALRG